MSQPSAMRSIISGSDGPSLRCPDCGHTEKCNSYAAAASLQTSKPCPNCNRMMALSEGSV